MNEAHSFIPFASVVTVLATLVDSYVSSIRNGAVPCIDSAVTAMATLENSRVIAEALEKYKEGMARLMLPTEDDTALAEAHSLALDEAIEYFAEKSIFDNDHKFRDKLSVSVFSVDCDSGPFVNYSIS